MPLNFEVHSGLQISSYLLIGQMTKIVFSLMLAFRKHEMILINHLFYQICHCK